ncbi:MAG: hypothetical protein E4H13_06315 [Calditrichales bacterium]|nr:MAG: hypothetical protein E4H13_06315 [Calditrichales bacterium]
MEGGFSIKNLMNLVPGLAIVGIGILSKYFPRVTSVVVFLITAALEFAIFTQGLNWVQIGTAQIVGIPLMIAGVCLYIPSMYETGIEPVKSA